MITNAIDINKDFNDNYAEAKRYLLCVLANTNFQDMHSCNASSVIITYEKRQPKLLKYIEENLKPYFYYSLSLVGRNSEGVDYIFNNINPSIDDNLQKELGNIKCDNLLKHPTQY